MDDFDWDEAEAVLVGWAQDQAQRAMLEHSIAEPWKSWCPDLDDLDEVDTTDEILIEVPDTLWSRGRQTLGLSLTTGLAWATAAGLMIAAMI